eukprot:753162-Hanusia_phi.AAC.2
MMIGPIRAAVLYAGLVTRSGDRGPEARSLGVRRSELRKPEHPVQLSNEPRFRKVLRHEVVMWRLPDRKGCYLSWQ